MKRLSEVLPKETLLLMACQAVAEAKVAHSPDTDAHRRLCSVYRALRQLLPGSKEKEN